MAVKRILRYVKGTYKLGILYKRSSTNHQEESELIGFTDSDYAGDIDDRKNTFGYVYMIGSTAVCWSSRKQLVVTLSTTEAEFIAASASACQGVWLRRILEHLGMKQSGATTVYCDNSSTIKLSRNPVLHGRSKHIDIRFHFLRDLCRDEVIDPVHCSTNEQVADIMTKPLKLETFTRLRDLMGMTNMED